MLKLVVVTLTQRSARFFGVIRYAARLPGLTFLCVLLALAHPVSAQDDQWARTVARTAESVVSLQLSQLRSFGDADQGGSGGTGFVVDAERGIILTNRHIVGSGPVRFSATFQNQERVDAMPLYRDPVHDFAFLRYDPAKLQYAKPESLQLRPDKVRTGLNIRVLGSDGGEQLSILTGTIARIDREAPSYGRYGYNDFNTFYLQAASSTSGGSSGSPVIDFDGDVVALNAAANTRTASSFFLPLYRVQHALKRLQDNEAIDRGTLQTLFAHRPFRSLRRLGLDQATEDSVRQLDPTNNGMLTVSQILPDGVADGQFVEGDILVSVDGQLIANYVDLEAILDASIDKQLNVELVRQGEAIQVAVAVADLHALSPDRFVEIGDSIFQNMSIQHSRAMNLPQQGVVIVRPGYFLERANVPAGSVITELDGRQLNNVDDLLSVLRQERDGKMLARLVQPGREFTNSIAQIDIDNRWFSHQQCTRVDNARFWDCSVIELPDATDASASTAVKLPFYRDPLLNSVAPALVRVDFHIPHTLDNVYANHFNGVGLVVDTEEGLIAVDRNTVPIGLGDAEITFFGSTLLDARVVFLHPSHNIALLKYDPADLGDVDFEALELQVDNQPLTQPLFMIGYRQDGTFRKHPVTETSRLTLALQSPRLARFQQSVVDLYGVPDMPPSLGGPLVNADGVVQAIWMSFAYQDGQDIQQQEWAMPAPLLAEALRLYKSDKGFYSLDATLDYRPIALSRQLGLPDEWLTRYLALDAESRRVLYVQQVVPGTHAETLLEVGDILLAIDGELVADLFEVEKRVQKDNIDISVLRNGEVLQLNIKPSLLSTNGTDRIIQWAGATFQDAHREIALYRGVSPDGVYISSTQHGSPALWDRLFRNRFVTAVDGVAVTNLDEFLAEVLKKEQDQITRLSVVTTTGRRGIVSVQPEYQFWPTVELRRDEDKWQRLEHDH